MAKLCYGRFSLYLSLRIQDSTNFTLRSVDGSPSSLPLYTCEYTAMVSVSLSHTSVDVLCDFELKHGALNNKVQYSRVELT